MSAKRKDHWKEKLSESREALFALLNGLSAEQWQATVFAEGDTWTVATVLAHLVISIWSAGTPALLAEPEMLRRKS